MSAYVEPPKVNHPNVIRCLEIIDVANGAAAVIIMEALTGGEVLRQLGAIERYSEEVAAQVFTQVSGRCGCCTSLNPRWLQFIPTMQPQP